MAEKFDTQIARFDSRSEFLEVLNTAFPIGKVLINFCNYDEKTHKQKNKLEIYLDMGKAMVLADDILSGRLERRIAEAKRTGKYNGQAVSGYTSYFVDMGGVKFHQNKKFDKAKFDKYKANFDWLDSSKDLSRQLKLQESTKYKYMLRAEYGLGREDDKGLIVSEGGAKVYVQIPLTEESAIEFALAIRTHVEAYWNQYYAKFGDKLFRDQTCKVFTPNK